MKLYTIQHPNFDIVKTQSDPTKSLLYYKDVMGDKFGKAYDWLYQKLGTNNIIWCHSYADNDRHGSEFKRWELEIPENEIIAILDSDIWNCIINDWYPYPTDVWNQWYKESKEFPTEYDGEEYINQKEKEYSLTHDKENEKNNVFLKKIINDYHEYIIPSPIKPEWVVNVVHACGWSEDGCIWYYDGKISHEKSFDDCDDAFNYLEMCHSFLNNIGKTYNSYVVYKSNYYDAVIYNIS